ncbi:shikimate kinase [bacterium]|nr:shikimate kinase [bacterium]
MPPQQLTVSLIGYRGSGKSTIAPALADRLQCDWVDADIEIEKRAGRTIQQVFADGGETEFRQFERQLMQELLSQSGLVIAAGGGAILNIDTVAEMKSAGPVVLLNASVAELARRISTDATTGQRRPSLTGKPVEEEVAAVLEFRQPLYTAAATMVVETEDQTTQQIVDQICQQLGRDSAANETNGPNSKPDAGGDACI